MLLEEDGLNQVSIKTSLKLFRYWYFISVFALIACNSSLDDDVTRIGQNYYPMELGAYRIYDMQDTTYQLSGPDIKAYFLMEVVADSQRVLDSFGNATDEIKYTLERYSRVNNNERWKLDSIWSSTVTRSRVVQVENGIPLIKLVFPIENNLSWDANGLNGNNQLDYKYSNRLSDTLLFETSIYKDLRTVIQKNQEEDFLGKDYREEVYAPDVGLLIKIESTWTFDQSSENKKIIDGRGLVQTLIEYGKE